MSLKVNKTGTPKSAPYLRLKILKEQLLETFGKDFFRKSIWFKKSHNAEKLKKGHLGSLNVFYKPKTSKKCKGVPFDKIRSFSKKIA